MLCKCIHYFLVYLEPRTAVTDCWAQGAVPLTLRRPDPITEEMEKPGSPRKLQSPRFDYSSWVGKEELCQPLTI